MVSGLCEMQTASFRRWARVAVSIFYGGYYYTNSDKDT